MLQGAVFFGFECCKEFHFNVKTILFNSFQSQANVFLEMRQGAEVQCGIRISDVLEILISNMITKQKLKSPLRYYFGVSKFSKVMKNFCKCTV